MFLHGLKNGRLFLPLDNEVEDCRLLSDPARAFKTTTDKNGITLTLTGVAPDTISSVVVLKIKGEPKVSAANMIQQQEDGTIDLPAQKATIHNVFNTSVTYESDKGCIGCWTNPRVNVEWNFVVKTPGTYQATAWIAAQRNSGITVKLAGQSANLFVPATGGYAKFEPLALGSFTVDKAGKYTLIIQPGKKNWQPINLRSLTLSPAE